MKLTITADVAHASIPFLRRKLRAASRMIRTQLRECSIVLVNDKTMSDLHKRIMGTARPTDVLTFPLDLDWRDRAISGEIVICVPEARRRARELRLDVRHELLLYAIHGMLHLSGFDDRTPAEYRRMHRMEDRILSRVGVGPVFFQSLSRGARGKRP